MAQKLKVEKLPIAQIQNINQLVKNELVEKQIAAVAPELNPKQILKTLAAHILEDDSLNRCKPMSILSSLVACVSLGLRPNTPAGEAYLIPFGENCKLVIGYRGMINTLGRMGNISTISANVVYEGDEFDYVQGTDPKIVHRSKIDPTKDGVVATHAYAVCKLQDGNTQFVVLHWGEIEKIKETSKGGGKIWKQWEKAMAQKTAIRALFKHMPIHQLSAADLDETIGSSTYDMEVEPQMRMVSTPVDGHKPMTQRAPVAAPAADPDVPPDTQEPPTEAETTIEHQPAPVEEVFEYLSEAGSEMRNFEDDARDAEDLDDLKAAFDIWKPKFREADEKKMMVAIKDREKARLGVK